MSVLERPPDVVAPALVADLELEPPGLDADEQAAQEKKLAADAARVSLQTPQPLAEAQTPLYLLATTTTNLSTAFSLLFEEAKHFEPHRHPRWPAGTPGGLGGQFMHVGQRFRYHGADYDVAAVLPGKIWAHLATRGASKAPKTIEISSTELATEAAGFSAQEKAHAAGQATVQTIPGVERPEAEVITSSKTQTKTMTATVVDPYVDHASHDPSIAVPEVAKNRITSTQWQRFGKLDQERFAQLCEKHGAWEPGVAQSKVNASLAAADGASRDIIKSGYHSQLGASSGFTLNLITAFNAVKGLIKGDKKVEEARTTYERARAAQDEVAGVLQWDLYHRTKAPDLASFHKNSTKGLFDNEVIKGDLPVFSGLSQSQHWRGKFWKDNTFATPLAIRHIVMATTSAEVVPTGEGLKREQEVATADSFAADSRSLSFGIINNPIIDQWLNGETNEGTTGEVIETLRAAFLDGGAQLPPPKIPANLQYVGQGSSGPTYIAPPPEATKGIGALSYAELDENGNPIARPVNDLGLQPGDYIEGMKGTRYVIVADPGYEFGISMYKVTDTGQPIAGTGSEVAQTSQKTSAYESHNDFAGVECYKFDNPAQGNTFKAFKRLNGHFDMPVYKAEKEEEQFDPSAWVASAKDDKKMVKDLPVGGKFYHDGQPFEMLGAVHGEKASVKNLANGKEATIASYFSTTYLIATKEAGPPEPVAPAAPKVGSTVAYEGKKATVTKLLKDGQVQLNLAPGMVKLAADDPVFEHVFHADDFELGPKAKLKQFAPGELFHGGTGSKVRPYKMLGTTETGHVLVRNLDTGEESLLSGGKSYTRLVVKQTEATAPPEGPTLAEAPAVVFDKADWEAGPEKPFNQLQVGEKFFLGGDYEVAEKLPDGSLTVKNLATGALGPGGAASETWPVQTIVPKGTAAVPMPEPSVDPDAGAPKPFDMNDYTPGLGMIKPKDAAVGDLLMAPKSGNVYKVESIAGLVVGVTVVHKPGKKGTTKDAGEYMTLKPSLLVHKLTEKPTVQQPDLLPGQQTVTSGYVASNYTEQPNKINYSFGELAAGALMTISTGTPVEHMGEHPSLPGQVLLTNLLNGHQFAMSKTGKPPTLLTPKSHQPLGYEDAVPGDTLQLGALPEGAQFTVGDGQGIWQMIDPSTANAQNALVAPVLPGGGLGFPTSDNAYPMTPVVLHAKADAPPPQMSAAEVDALTPDADKLPELPGYKTFAFHKSGKKSYPFLKTMVEGTVFRGSEGNPLLVKKQGATMVVTDGEQLYKLDGGLRGFVLEEHKFVDNTALLPTSAQNAQAVAGMKSAVVNTDDHTLAQLGAKAGDYVSDDDGHVWEIAVNDIPAGLIELYSPTTQQKKQVTPGFVPAKLSPSLAPFTAEALGAGLPPPPSTTGNAPGHNFQVGEVVTFDNPTYGLTGLKGQVLAINGEQAQILSSSGEMFPTIPVEWIKGSLADPGFDAATYGPGAMVTASNLQPGDLVFLTKGGSIKQVYGKSPSGDVLTLNPATGIVSTSFYHDATVTTAVPKAQAVPYAGPLGDGFEFQSMSTMGALQLGDVYTAKPDDPGALFKVVAQDGKHMSITKVWAQNMSLGIGNTTPFNMDDADASMPVALYTQKLAAPVAEPEPEPVAPSFSYEGSPAAELSPNLGGVTVGDMKLGEQFGGVNGAVYEKVSGGTVGQIKVKVVKDSPTSASLGTVESIGASFVPPSVQVSVPAAASATATPTPVVEQPTLDPDKQHALSVFNQGDLVQTTYFNGPVMRIVSKDENKVTMVVVKEPSLGGAFVPHPYKKFKLGQTVNLKPHSMWRPHAGPLWKVGEYVKVTAPGKKAGKTGRVAGLLAGTDGYNVLLPDGSTMSTAGHSLVATNPQKKTKDTLKFPEFSVGSAETGDLVFRFGRPYIVGEKKDGKVYAKPGGYGAASVWDEHVLVEMPPATAGSASKPIPPPSPAPPPPIPMPPPPTSLDQFDLTPNTKGIAIADLPVGSIYAVTSGSDIAVKKVISTGEMGVKVETMHNSIDPSYVGSTQDAMGDYVPPQVSSQVALPAQFDLAPNTAGLKVSQLAPGDEFKTFGVVYKVSGWGDSQHVPAEVLHDENGADEPGTTATFLVGHQPDEVSSYLMKGWEPETAAPEPTAPTPPPTAPPPAGPYVPSEWSKSEQQVKIGDMAVGTKFVTNTKKEYEKVSHAEVKQLKTGKMFATKPHVKGHVLVHKSGVLHEPPAAALPPAKTPGEQISVAHLAVGDHVQVPSEKVFRVVDVTPSGASHDFVHVKLEDPETGEIAWDSSVPVSSGTWPWKWAVAPTTPWPPTPPPTPQGTVPASSVSPTSFVQLEGGYGIEAGTYQVLSPSAGPVWGLGDVQAASPGAVIVQNVETKQVNWVGESYPVTPLAGLPEPPAPPEPSPPEPAAAGLQPFPFHKSGSKSYKGVGTLQPGAQFTEKSGVTYTVASTYQGHVVYVDPAGKQYVTPTHVTDAKTGKLKPVYVLLV